MKLLIAVCLTVTSFFSTADEVIREAANGSVNWSQGVIYAQGFGTAREGMPEAQGGFLPEERPWSMVSVIC